MGLSHWVRNTIDDFREDPSLSTAEISTRKFWAGLLGRFATTPEKERTIWEMEWDILVVLDACRVDLLKEVLEEGTFELPSATAVESIWSVGSTSDEWLLNTFSDEYRSLMGETAYVTGNPYAHNLESTDFKDFVHVGMTDLDEGITTVAPRSITDLGIECWKRSEGDDLKRLILHYMQPHTPFRSRPEWFESFRGDEKFGSEVWWRLCEGTLSQEDVWAAYADNLGWVLNDLEILTHSLDARIGITADHGNAMGESGIYGHPEGVPVETVRRVPWLVVDGEDTGEYEPRVTEETVETVETTQDVEDQLSALGYR